MNKHLILMGMAAAMLMTSCANDDELAGGNGGQTVGNSDVPITLTAGQQANKTRASLGNEEGNFATPEGKNLGFYCLATGKIAGTENITWHDGYDNPNFLWIQNIQAKAVINNDGDLERNVTDLVLYDAAGTTQTNYFYPMGSQYSYTFYGYYPYSAAVQHVNNKYTVAVTGLDGTTDLIWGKSFVNPDDLDAVDAYSAKYIRDKKKRVLGEGKEWDDKARKEARPQLTFKHKLMKFNIILAKGSGENTNIDKLGIMSAKLLNVADAGTLTIADLDNRLGALTDDATGKEGEFNVDWTTAARHNTEANAFVLKNADGSSLGQKGDQYPGPYLGTNDRITVGDGFLIPVPKSNGDGTYVDNGYLGTGNAELANKGIFRLRIDYFMQNAPDKLYKAAQYEVRPVFKENTDETWQEGYEYDIVISVSDPEQIKLGGELTPWEKKIIELE